MESNQIEDDFLAWLLHPISPEDFFKRYWGGRACLFEPRSNVVALPTSEELLANLDAHRTTYPSVRASGCRGDADPLIYTFSTGRQWDPRIKQDRVRMLMKAGFTLRWSDVTTTSLAAKNLKMRAESSFGCGVEINAYVNGESSEGTLPHYDSHHVFALQVSGEKSWRLGTTVFQNPTSSIHPYPNVVPDFIEEITTRAGQMLYLPPGMWHQAVAGGASFHLAVGVRAPNWADFLRTVVYSAAEKHYSLRAPLTMRYSNGTCKYETPNSIKVKEALDIVLDLFDRHVNETVVTNSCQIENSVTPVEQSTETIASVDQRVAQALNLIWEMCNTPISLYLRGSASRRSVNRQPWDLDVVVILRPDAGGSRDELLARVREAYANRFCDLPSLDLAICTLEELRDDSSNVIRRHLLKKEGRLVLGEPILENIPACTTADFPTIWARSSEIASKKMEECLKHLRDFPPSASAEVAIEIRRAAKAILRLLGAARFRTSAILIRDPIECASMVDQSNEATRRAAQTLVLVVQGRFNATLSMVEAARLIIAEANTTAAGQEVEC